MTIALIFAKFDADLVNISKVTSGETKWLRYSRLSKLLHRLNEYNLEKHALLKIVSHPKRVAKKMESFRILKIRCVLRWNTDRQAASLI